MKQDENLVAWEPNHGHQARRVVPAADRCAAFERRYIGQHMPLMRKLVGPGAPLPTYRTIGFGERQPPFYRVAEIHFRDMAHFNEFTGSGRSKIGHDSSVEVSTGGKPIYLVCEEQPPI